MRRLVRNMPHMLTLLKVHIPIHGYMNEFTQYNPQHTYMHNICVRMYTYTYTTHSILHCAEYPTPEHVQITPKAS